MTLRRARDLWRRTLLLGAALLDGEAARKAFRAWRRRVDPMALDAESEKLLPRLARNLVRLGVDDPHLERWKGVSRRTFAANAVLFRDLGHFGATDRIVVGSAAVIALFPDEISVRPLAAVEVRPPGAGRYVEARLGATRVRVPPIAEQLLHACREGRLVDALLLARGLR